MGSRHGRKILILRLLCVDRSIRDNTITPWLLRLCGVRIVRGVVQRFAVAFCFFVFVFGESPRAATLLNDQIKAQYFFPDINTEYPSATPPAPFTVVAGEDAIMPIHDIGGDTTLHFDFEANSLVVTFETTLQKSRAGVIRPWVEIPLARTGQRSLFCPEVRSLPQLRRHRTVNWSMHSSWVEYCSLIGKDLITTTKSS